MFDGDGAGPYVPVISIAVLKGTSMAGTRSKTFRFIGKGIVWLNGIRPQWIFGNIYGIGIAFKFGSRPGILQIIRSVVFVYPGTFNPGALLGQRVKIAGHFPSMYFCIGMNKFRRFTHKVEIVVVIELHAID